MKKIFLCCGAGMSSGFLAQTMRKAAKKKKLNYEIKAASESDIESYIGDTDIVLLGPHMTYLIDEVKDKAEQYKVPMVVIPEDIYGELDGEKMLEQVQSILEKE
ncbi:PTS sugar transporter subunit IIB [Candidatus Enterococcus willemsii]|uniref:PTS sugar transporter subunit IIB n=1 Tax=Candidatus Enterococcus willemsii TaxID=1857215 RepID=A0ABQ6Z0Z3_9ENTE|nr:PTS sugar transporter subunit IIB [Enterococcus sp. CU12B]KAF1305010.1 PTS sugar transporter subunit IIB [Enterococcus sp. CU12B]